MYFILNVEFNNLCLKKFFENFRINEWMIGWMVFREKFLFIIMCLVKFSDGM